MVQWGIIGAGNVAARFAASLEHEPESRLAAISCRNREKGERFLSNFPADRVYVNHEELLHDRRIDAVYLSLPHGLHKEWAVKALQAGKAVLCEKPAALNAGEMREIAETARERDVLFMEAMKPRFVPLYQKIKALVSEGRIGSVVRVTTSLCNQFSFSPNHPTYHTQPGQGGALLDEGIYCASWLQDFLSGNASVTQIAANMKDGIDYYIDAQLDFLPGQTGRLECAFDRLAPRIAVIYGTHGWLEIEDFHRPQVLRLNADEEKTRIIRMPYETDDFYGEIHHFVECVNDGRKESAIMPLSSSIACAEILDAVRESLKLTPRCLETLERQEAILRATSFVSFNVTLKREEGKIMEMTPFHAYRHARMLENLSDEEKLRPVYASSDIQVYPYQIAAAGFALRLPWQKGAILCDEADMGKAMGNADYGRNRRRKRLHSGATLCYIVCRVETKSAGNPYGNEVALCLTYWTG